MDASRCHPRIWPKLKEGIGLSQKAESAPVRLLRTSVLLRLFRFNESGHTKNVLFGRNQPNEVITTKFRGHLEAGIHYHWDFLIGLCCWGLIRRTACAVISSTDTCE
jgi:hypothetical protein